MSDKTKPANTLSLVAGDKDESRKALAEFTRNLPTIIEYYQINAKIAKAAYDANIAEDFTPEQAIFLASTMGK